MRLQMPSSPKFHKHAVVKIDCVTFRAPPPSLSVVYPILTRARNRNIIFKSSLNPAHTVTWKSKKRRLFMELKSVNHAILAGIGCAALLAYILACTSFSPDDSQVLYPVFDQPSGTISIAVYDRATGRSEPVLPALPPAQAGTNRTSVRARAQGLPDGKHVLIATVDTKADDKLSLAVVPHGVKEPVRRFDDIAMKASMVAIMYRLSVAGSKLVVGDDNSLTCIDFTTGQTTRHENTNKLTLAFGGDGKTISAIKEVAEKGGTAFGVLDPQTMAFSPLLALTNNICSDLKGSFPTFNLKERQAVFIAENEGKAQLKVVNVKGETFSRTIEPISTNTTLAGLGLWLDVGPRNDRLFTCYILKTAATNEAEYGIVEIPFNREPLRWTALFRAVPKDGDLQYAQASLSNDGHAVAMATTYMYMENDSLKPEDCALFLVEVGQAMPKITKVPIVPPRERKEY